MHIALIGTRGVPAKYGGFETCAEEISTRISSMGHKVTVYCRNGNYDVVVPGSGGKDSFYVAHKLKYEYGMNPLTVTFSPFLYTDWGWKNLQNWISSGFENILNSPNRHIYRLLSRIALENMFHPWHPWILGQKNFPPKIAANDKGINNFVGLICIS